MPRWESLEKSSRLFESDIQAIAEYTWELNSDVKYFTHHFVGIEFYSDEVGSIVTPSSGAYTVTVETRDTPGVYQAPPSNIIDASDRNSVDFSGNPTAIKITFDTIVGATHFKIRLASNRT